MPRAILALVPLLLAACAADAPPPAHGPDAPPPPPVMARPTGGAPSGGSSDGVSCEEARDKNVEELALGQKGEKDLTAGDLGSVLNKGTYLNECGVPSETKVNVCVAVKNGAAVGVTVGMAPASPELETCVAKAVRGMSFPAHPKMDIVRTEF